MTAMNADTPGDQGEHDYTDPLVLDKAEKAAPFLGEPGTTEMLRAIAAIRLLRARIGHMENAAVIARAHSEDARRRADEAEQKAKQNWAAYVGAEAMCTAAQTREAIAQSNYKMMAQENITIRDKNWGTPWDDGRKAERRDILRWLLAQHPLDGKVELDLLVKVITQGDYDDESVGEAEATPKTNTETYGNEVVDLLAYRVGTLTACLRAAKSDGREERALEFEASLARFNAAILILRGRL